MTEKHVKIAAAVLVVVLAGLVAAQWIGCAADGKAFVRGVVGFECVAR